MGSGAAGARVTEGYMSLHGRIGALSTHLDFCMHCDRWRRSDGRPVTLDKKEEGSNFGFLFKREFWPQLGGGNLVRACCMLFVDLFLLLTLGTQRGLRGPQKEEEMMGLQWCV